MMDGLRWVKGQAALEFLMTYGWAIVVSAIVMLVAWQMGVFDLTASSKTTYSGFWGVIPIDLIYKSDGCLTLVLQNNVGDNVNITGIDVTSEGSESISFTPPENISAGGVLKKDPLTTNLPKEEAGSGFNIFVSIDYIDDRVGPDTTFRSSGNIRGRVVAA